MVPCTGRRKEFQFRPWMVLSVHRQQVLHGDLSVNLRRGHGCMSQNCLDIPNVGSAAQEVGRAAMPQHVGRDALRDARGFSIEPDKPVEALHAESAPGDGEKQRGFFGVDQESRAGFSHIATNRLKCSNANWDYPIATSLAVAHPDAQGACQRSNKRSTSRATVGRKTLTRRSIHA